MDIPNEIFHEIISHLPIIDIVKVENALDIVIPDYLYLQVHRRNFKDLLDEINNIDYEFGGSSLVEISVRKVGPNKPWRCIYAYHNLTQDRNINKFTVDKADSNTLTVVTPKISESFTEHIRDKVMSIITIRKPVDIGTAILAMPKGDKTRYGINNSTNGFIYSSYAILLMENNIE